MNSKIAAQNLDKGLFNQKLDKHILTSVFSQHFLSKFMDKILPIELLKNVHLHVYHQCLEFYVLNKVGYMPLRKSCLSGVVYFSEL